MDKVELLESVRKDIIDRNVCPDLALGANNLVMGSGSVDADIIFIGEAPGRKEDEVGVPFVGASGRLLDEMLLSIGLKRSEIYITNIVKYRPPNNRDPSPLEKQEFLPYLLRQIYIIKPKIIVTLGRHSMEYFLPGSKISEVHGEPAQVNVNRADGDLSLVVVPLFHPAVALYNGSMRNVLLSDFAKLPDITRSLD